MERRNLLVLLAVLLVALFAFSGTASAHKASGSAKPAVEEPTCVIHSLPSFIDQGEFGRHSSVGDVIEVECKAVYAEHKVQISAHELASRCRVVWIFGHGEPVEKLPFFAEGPTVKGVELDDAGNAEIAFYAGPSCAAGEVLISAHLEEAPYTTVTTAYTVLSPRDTTPGVEVFGATDKPVQVEDDFDSSLFAIVEVEFPSVYAEQEVEISAEQLYARCGIAPKLNWLTGELILFRAAENARVKLDNNGNAFVYLFAEESCASGRSEIEASLVKAPYTTYTTELEIESPHETI